MKFKKPDLKKIERDCDAIVTEFTSAETFDEQNKALKKMFKYSDHIRTNFSIAHVKYTCDTQDPQNVKNQELVDEISPIIGIFSNKFNKALVNAKFRPELEAKWGTHLFNMVQNELDTFDEKIVPELQEINKLSSEYTKLIASAKIEFRGEVYNLSQLGKFATSSDRQTRKEAAKASAGFFEEHFDEIGAIYDKLVKTRHAMAQKLGYENYIDLGYKSLGRTDYNAADVKGYREQIYTDLVPFTNKLFKDQAFRNSVRYVINLVLWPLLLAIYAIFAFIYMPWAWALLAIVALIPAPILAHEAYRLFRIMISDIKLWRNKELRAKYKEIREIMFE
jgi:M3 family oligoendopeptidase